MKNVTVGDLIDSIEDDLYDRKNKTEWLSATDISKELKLHINTVYLLLQQGDIKSYNCSVNGKKNYYRVRRSDLEDYLQRRYRCW